MRLKGTGEDNLIERISRKIKTECPGVLAGIGDDAAVIKKDEKTLELVTLDMLVEDVHFTRRMSFFDIGHKALGVNLSDIAAMGGSPKYAFTSIGLKDDASEEDVEALYDGMLSLAGEYGVQILGGDTNRSPEAFVVDVCLTGEVAPENLCLRSGAKPGDLIFVTGALGASGVSFKRGEYLPVVPRLKELGPLFEIARPTSMMDISDGLSKDLGRICRSSKAGARVFEEKIPKAEGASLETALGWGEDFELLFTAPAKEKEKLLSLFPERSGTPLSQIGEITEEEGVFIVYSGNRAEPMRGGYDHF